MRVPAILIVCVVASPLTAADVISGVVTPVEEFVVTTPVSGIVDEVMVREGDHVQKGQLLAKLESTPQELQFAQARAKHDVVAARLKLLQTGASPEEVEIIKAELAAGQAQLDHAEQSYARAKKLYQSKAKSEKEVIELEQELIFSKDRVAQLKARLAGVQRGRRPQELAIAEAELMLARTAVEAAQYRVDQGNLLSPIDGTVLRMNLQVGGYAQPATSSIIVADLERLTVAASIPEARLRDLKEGTTCRVKTAAGELDGAVSSIAISANNGRVGFVIQLEETDGKLLPGMKANVFLAVPQAR